MKRIKKLAALTLTVTAIVIGSAGIISQGEYYTPEPEEKKQSTPKEVSFSVRLGRNIVFEGDYANVLNLKDAGGTIGSAEFVTMLTGEDGGQDKPLTREEAAFLAYEYLLCEGFEPDENAGNLSMFPDGLYCNPAYAKGVSELVRLNLMPLSGKYLKPHEPLSRGEAKELVSAVHGFAKMTESEDFGAMKLLDIDTQGFAVLENLLACVISAMHDEGIFSFGEKADAKMMSLAAYKALSWGIVPDSFIEYADKSITIISQANMKNLYNGIFTYGLFYAFDSMSAQDKIMVLGDSLVFFPGEKRGMTVSAGTVTQESAGVFTAYCTVYRGREYYCTAVVTLEKTNSWAAGFSVTAAKLTMG